MPSSEEAPLPGKERVSLQGSQLPSRQSKLRELYRWLVLAPELERVRREGFAPGQSGHVEFMLGREALLDARALAASRASAGPALLLFRSSVLSFARAHEARASLVHASPGPRLGDLLALPTVAGAFDDFSPEQRLVLEAALDFQTGESTLARLEGAERRALLPLFERLALELGEPLERDADPVRRIQAAHWVRKLLLVVLIASVAGWFGFALFGRKNLALNMPVVTSSADPKLRRVNPRALVDGDRRNLGFHTSKGRGQFATIDLGDVKSVHSVTVYNRIDCCQGRAVPLRLDVSTDGVSWTTLARRTETFMTWVVPVPPTVARYVRLTGEANNFLHLAEVEVY